MTKSKNIHIRRRGGNINGVSSHETELARCRAEAHKLHVAFGKKRLTVLSKKLSKNMDAIRTLFEEVEVLADQINRLANVVDQS